MKVLAVILLAGLALTGCLPGQIAAQTGYAITVVADGKQTALSVPAGSTAQIAVERAGIKLGSLDRLQPSGFTVVAPGDKIQVIRVREEFSNKDNTIPFERQTVKNESMPEGQTMLIQSGVNGMEQVTYRKVFENEQQVSESVFKSTVVTDPKPEIVMVGVQKPFTALSIVGRLAYMAGGNAWIMEKTTGQRRPVVTTGDLDGRVFNLSSDASTLLFTRKSTRPANEEINTLWMVNLDDPSPKPISLRVSNIIQYAGWVPGRGLTVAYSTVEPRSTAPGWQANNDLTITTYNTAGVIIATQKVIEANTGGVYGWWGTYYAWSPDGNRLAYARPDGVGLIDLENKNLAPLVDFTPYQTRADWAWVTGLAWAPNNRVLYMVTHAAQPGLDNQESSPLFDLSARVLEDGPTLDLAPQSGMFGYPVVSPVQANKDFKVAFLQSIFPEQSDTGRYRLVVMDRDGSNRETIFPSEGLPGIEPQQVVWSRQSFPKSGPWIALTYQGNLWLIDPETKETHQVTGDGLIKRIDW